jgi:hypothetical protein
VAKWFDGKWVNWQVVWNHNTQLVYFESREEAEKFRDTLGPDAIAEPVRKVSAQKRGRLLTPRWLKAIAFAFIALMAGALTVLYAGKVIYAVVTYGLPDPNGSEATVQVGMPALLMAGAGTLALWAFRRALTLYRR